MSNENESAPIDTGKETPFSRLGPRQKTWIVGGIIGWAIGTLAGGSSFLEWLGKVSEPRFSVEANNYKFVPPIVDIYPKMGISEGGKLEDIHGVLVVTVKNVGELDAENVKLDARDSGFAAVHFDDDSGDSIEFNRRIDIGTIHSGQTVNVVVWGNDNSFFQDGSPLITHRHGQQAISEPYPLFHRSEYLITFLLCAVVGGLVSVAAGFIKWTVNQWISPNKPTAAADALSGEPQTQIGKDQPES